MRHGHLHKLAINIAGSALLTLGLFSAASAVAATINPDASLPGIAQAGYPSFTFGETDSGYGNNIQKWFSNYSYIKREAQTYQMTARSSGDFKFWIAEDSYYSGNSGTFDMNAIFDLDGNLLSGDAIIRGALPELGINSVQDLMIADLVADGFAYQNNLLGFRIMITYCPEQIDCNTVPESIYFYTDKEFKGFASMNGSSPYFTTMAVKATVPVPASAWLMLSGLVILGTRVKYKAKAG